MKPCAKISSSLQEVLSMEFEVTAVKMKRAGIPKRYWAIQLEDVQDQSILDQMAFLCHLIGTAPMSPGFGIMMTGEPWSGKTAFSSVLLRVGISRGSEVLYTRSLELVQDWKNRLDYNPEETLGEHYRHADFVVVDDLGLENGDARALKHLEYVLRLRYENDKSTIVISNYGRKELKLMYPATLFSVLERMSDYYFVLLNRQWKVKQISVLNHVQREKENGVQS